MTLQRYDIGARDGGIVGHPDGDWVSYADHVAEVARLRGEAAATKDKLWTYEKANADLHDKVERLEARCADGWKSPDQQARERNALTAERDALAKQVAELRELLTRVAPFIIPTDHEGRPEEDLRGQYPDSCAAIDCLRIQIAEALEPAP